MANRAPKNSPTSHYQSRTRMCNEILAPTNTRIHKSGLPGSWRRPAPGQHAQIRCPIRRGALFSAEGYPSYMKIIVVVGKATRFEDFWAHDIDDSLKTTSCFGCQAVKVQICMHTSELNHSMHPHMHCVALHCIPLLHLPGTHCPLLHSKTL